MTRTSADLSRRLFPSRRVLATCLVALLVVLAGCSGLLGGGSTSTPAPDAATTGSDGGDGTPTDAATSGGATGATHADRTSSAGETDQGSTSDAADDADIGGATASEGASVTGLRLAHMSPDAPALDLYIDNQTVITNVSIGDISEYTQVEPGTHHVRIADAENPDSVAFEQDQTFEAGNRTIKMLGEWTESGEAHVAPYLLADNDTPAGSNTAKVRLVHASPDAPTIDVTTAGGDRVLFDDVSFEESTDYVTLSPGEYTLQIREESPDNDGDVLTTETISVGGGGVYTAFVAGYLTPGDEPADMGFRLIGSVDTQPGNAASNGSG